MLFTFWILGAHFSQLSPVQMRMGRCQRRQGQEESVLPRGARRGLSLGSEGAETGLATAGTWDSAVLSKNRQLLENGAEASVALLL